ncbi:MAG: type IV pilus modification protein PilV [Cycloclasticus sp.]|nr:type IV pilus modification protein PilV [Cycloclasticus sp.]
MTTKLNTSKGFSLIEVMVAVFVLAIGLLGIAGLQVTAIKSNHTAMSRTQSTQLAYDLADRMRANMPGTIAGNYLATSAPSETYNCFDDFTGVGTGECSPLQMAHADLDWAFELAADTLPFVSAAVSCTSPGGTTVTADTGAEDCAQGFTHTITVTWSEQDDSNGLVSKSMSVEFQP